MKVILNGHKQPIGFAQALSELTKGAEALSVAVSYINLGGWEIFKNSIKGLDFKKTRIVCTDQFGITQPMAVKAMIESNLQIHNFSGKNTYHPKVFLAHGKNNKPIRFLLGSANLSKSAFSTGVEAGLLSEDIAGLKKLHEWFDDLFSKNSESFTPALLAEMEEKWRLIATSRIHGRIKVRKDLSTLSKKIPPISLDDIDMLDDILATIHHPIGLLNMDHAANNVRNLDKVRNVLSNPGAAHDKQKSELKLLGFMAGKGVLTPLGHAARKAKTNEEVARLWFQWIKHTPDTELESLNARLLVAQRVFRQFWLLKKDVRDYFLANAIKPKNRRVMQTIELFCNATQIVQDLSLDEIMAISKLLEQRQNEGQLKGKVLEYFNNKGPRGWTTSDRYVLPLAWKA